MCLTEKILLAIKCFQSQKLVSLVYGRLGKIIKKIAKGFNLKVITYDKAKDKKSKLFQIFNGVDYVSLNIPLRKNSMFFSRKKFSKKLSE